MDRPQPVLDFWFGPADAACCGQRRDWWFGKDPAIDCEIRRTFGVLIEAALAGGLRDWDATPGGALARILVLDQFTRNAFRDTPRAFAGDILALPAAEALVARGADRELLPQQRAFAYLPFEHAEALPAQDRAVALFATLATEHADCADYLDYARRHRDIIARYGRFPHRNAILGRPSTEEESAFLHRPGSRF